MITWRSSFSRKDKTTGKDVYKFGGVGLKADVATLPTDEIDGALIENGSSFMEIDDAGFYMFDAENKEWKAKA